LGRTRRWWRLEENFGEDPALVAKLGVAMARGMQGQPVGPPAAQPAPQPADRYFDGDYVACEAKHGFAYLAAAEDGGPVQLGERTLMDAYMRPWRDFAAAGGREMMASHQSFNDVPSHANTALLTGVMRERFGFWGGIIASDDSDTAHLVDIRVAANTSQAAALAVRARMDQDLHCVAFPTLNDTVRSGAVNASFVDRAAGNVLRQKFPAGLFDGAWRPNASRLAVLDSPAHRALARRTATEGAVLLVNRQPACGAAPALPLRLRPGAALAVVGPNAGCFDNATACAATDAACGGYSNKGAPVVTVLEALREAAAAAGATVRAAQGASIDNRTMDLIPEAVWGSIRRRGRRCLG